MSDIRALGPPFPPDLAPRVRVTDPAYAKTLELLRATAQPTCTLGPPGFLWDAEPATP